MVVIEKAETEEDEPQPKDGELEASVEAVPVTHLSWKTLPVKRSRFMPPPNELAQVYPEKVKSPYVEKDPMLKVDQSKPVDCWGLQ